MTHLSVRRMSMLAGASLFALAHVVQASAPRMRRNYLAQRRRIRSLTA